MRTPDHSVEQRQGDGCADAPEDGAARELLVGIGHDAFDELREGFVTANRRQRGFAAGAHRLSLEARQRANRS